MIRSQILPTNLFINLSEGQQIIDDLFAPGRIGDSGKWHFGSRHVAMHGSLVQSSCCTDRSRTKVAMIPAQLSARPTKRQNGKNQ